MGIYHLLASDVMHDFLLDSSVRETPIQADLRKKTLDTIEEAFMMTVPEQVQLIAFLMELMEARRVIDVGVFTGYSTLAIAQALPKNGEVIACEINVDWVDIGKPYWKKAGVDEKIKLKIAPAVETLQQLIDANESHRFDFVFVDADKINYSNYYELSLELIRPGGLIAFDNVIRMANAFVYEQTNPASKAIYEMCYRLRDDKRVSISMIPVGEGMLLVRKR